ncbi:spermatogenesis-associated protein 17 [Dinochytrium kinnereticum]|nr:spermatogenesis-associated protein 17 [Dinochytrium kinnereticum]
MAAQFARLWQLRGSDVFDEFFERSWEAESNRTSEHRAAMAIQRRWRGFQCRARMADLIARVVRIQRIFRGFVGRRKFTSEWHRQVVEHEMMFKNEMAVKLQKTWRGYHTRRTVFDFRKRKAFIEFISKQMEDTRMRLQNHHEAQKRLDLETRARTLLSWVDRFAGKNHHLVGTKAIPGILSKTPSSAVELEKIMEQIREKRETETPTRTPPPRVLAPIACHIPEIKLKESAELKEWIRTHVGRNPGGIRVKPKPPTMDPKDPSLKEKTAQGPFLPRVYLEKKRSKPLKPSLRVQTDFFDTLNHKREERRQEVAKRVSDRVFATVRHMKYEAEICSLGGGPYQRIKSFRDVDRSKFIAKQDFKIIIPPVPLFENLMDDY